MQAQDVEAIAVEWLARTGADPSALRRFLAESVPEVDAWALRRSGPEPQLFAITARHLYRIQPGEQDGRRAISLERLPLAETSVSLVELRDEAAVRRRWTLRTHDDGLIVETEQRPGEEPPALESVMRMVLERAR
jgi:hypothetical protein